MALIHQNLYQEDNPTGIEVKEYFEKLTAGLFHSYNISPDRIRLEMNIQDVKLDVDSVIPLGLILNELVSNALKHAFQPITNGTIRVTLQEQNQKLELSVNDDGAGMSQLNRQILNKSFGFRLIRVFTEKLDGELSIDSTDGTDVKLTLREYRKVA